MGMKSLFLKLYRVIYNVTKPTDISVRQKRTNSVLFLCDKREMDYTSLNCP
jgi:hypothetical protein